MKGIELKIRRIRIEKSKFVQMCWERKAVTKYDEVLHIITTCYEVLS